MVSFRFVDDVQYYKVYDSTVNKGKPFAIDTSPHYWILNTAVGGFARVNYSLLLLR